MRELQPRALCADEPHKWDIDWLYNASKSEEELKDAVMEAVARCHRDCPLFEMCEQVTQKHINRGKPPIGIVQAGIIWLEPHASGTAYLARKISWYYIGGRLRRKAQQSA